MGRSAAQRARVMVGAAIVAGSVGGGAIAAAGPAGAVTAVTLYVNGTQGAQTTGCTGPGPAACKTIQEAVNAAAAYLGVAVTITVAAGTYAGGIVITSSNPASVTIDGAGANTTVVTGSGTTQGFLLTAVTVTISGISITTARAQYGAGVSNFLGRVTLTNDTFTTDQATTDGGAVTTDAGTLTVTHDTFTTDSAGYVGGVGGGASVYHSFAVITDSTFTNDRTDTGGGGVGIWGGSTAVVLDDTFSTDGAPDGGGLGVEGTFTPGSPADGARLWSATQVPPAAPQGADTHAPQGFDGFSVATVTDDTFVGDFAIAGGAIFNAGFFAPGPASPAKGGGPDEPFLPLTATFDTFARDSANGGSGGLFNLDDGAYVGSSIFDGTSCGSVGGPVIGTYNVVTATTDCPSTTGVTTTTTAMGLATTLAPNTAANAPETLALTSTSPAVGEVPATACIVTVEGKTITTDERGFPRQSAATATCDAGAYELQTTTTTHHHPGVSILRTYGPTADATAAQELAASFPSCPGSTGNRPVVLATDQGFADALSSAYLAADLNTGTLLTPTGSLSAATLAALKAEGITHVYVVGGPLAISTAVISALESTPAYDCGGTTPTGSDIVVTRIAGTTAAETAADVAGFPGAGFVGTADLAGAYGKDDPAGGDPSTGPSAPGAIRTAIVTSDQEFQDAEGAAVLSYAAHLPIVLTTPGALPTATANAIAALGIQQVIVVGGPLAVSTAVAGALEADGVSVLRVAGTDFTGTSAELAALETGIGNEGFGWDARTPGFAVARGDGYQDGLAGADLAAHGSRDSGPIPLLLTGSATTLGAGLTAFLHQLAVHGVGNPGKPVSFLLALGGPLALTPGLLDSMVGDL